MNCYFIVVIRLEQRAETAVKLQQTLTKFGCNIKTRLGLHDVGDDYCANDGIIILQPCGEPDTIRSMVEALNQLEGVKARLVDLN